MICQPNECTYPNCPCPHQPRTQTDYQKPSYQEQLNYLDSLGDSVMIRAIKENVIVIRNIENEVKQEIEIEDTKLKILKKHIPNGCINLRSFREEDKLICMAMEEYAQSK